MGENRFKIVFEGALLPGVDITTAKLNLADLFKSDVTAIERLFAGRPVALKRNLTQADAQTYLQALSKTGIDARIEAETPIELNLADVHDHTPASNQAALAEPQSPYAPPRAPVGQAVAEFATLKPFSFDGRDIAFEQLGEIELCRGDVDTGQQGALEYDLEMIFAHVRSILVARG